VLRLADLILSTDPNCGFRTREIVASQNAGDLAIRGAVRSDQSPCLCASWPEDRVPSSLGPHGEYEQQSASEAELPLQFVTSAEAASVDIFIRFAKEALTSLAESLFSLRSFKQVPNEGISPIDQILQTAGGCGNRFIRNAVGELH